MGLINPTLPTVGDPRGSEESDILSALNTIITLLNGNLSAENIAADAIGNSELADNAVALANMGDASVGTAELINLNVTPDKLQAALAALLGVNQTGAVRRGVSAIATEEVRTNVAFGTLTTPDQVLGVAVPANGILRIGYNAMWKNSVVAAAAAAIFIDGVQVKVNAGGTAPIVSAASHQAGIAANSYEGLFTLPGYGLFTAELSGAAYTGDVTTGQVHGGRVDGVQFGGFVDIFGLPADTYDVTIQFKSTSGSVTVKERKLWVEAVGF